MDTELLFQPHKPTRLETCGQEKGQGADDTEGKEKVKYSSACMKNRIQHHVHDRHVCQDTDVGGGKLLADTLLLQEPYTVLAAAPLPTYDICAAGQMRQRLFGSCLEGV